MRTSSWGGLLALAAVRRGVAGVIVDGACRDIDEIRQLGLCVHARAAAPFTARGRLQERSVGEDIVVAGVTVSQWDYAVADGSGVVFIPADKCEKVVTLAESMAARERLMAEDIERGQAPTAVMGKAYEDLIGG